MSFSSSQPLATSSPRLCRRRRRLSFAVIDTNESKTPSPVLAPINYGGTRMILGEQLLEALKQFIDAFLFVNIQREHQPSTQTDTQTIRWTFDHGHSLNYSVVITFHQPTTSSPSPSVD